jgi:hypothetical protein
MNAFTEYLRLRQLTRPAMTTPGTNLQLRAERIELVLPAGKIAVGSSEPFFVNDALLLNRPLVGIACEVYAKPFSAIATGQFADVSAMAESIKSYIKGFKATLEMDGKQVFDRENVAALMQGIEFDPRQLPIAVSTISMTLETFDFAAGTQLNPGSNTAGVYSSVDDWIGGFDITLYKLENYPGLEKIGLPGCHKG